VKVVNKLIGIRRPNSTELGVCDLSLLKLRQGNLPPPTQHTVASWKQNWLKA